MKFNFFPPSVDISQVCFVIEPVLILYSFFLIVSTVKISQVVVSNTLQQKRSSNQPASKTQSICQPNNKYSKVERD